MNVVSWVIFGLVVGIVSYVLDSRPAQGGVISTIVLGILGAILGGFLGDLLFGVGTTDFNLSSFIVAVIGSLTLLFLGRMFQEREA